jgi:uncharacterized protein (DUF58 family)
MTITPHFLDELDRFEAALKRESNAPMQGEQDSEAQGEGLTFADYRRYSPGDDTRLIDWKLFARTEELYIKQFEEERNLTVHVLVDASGSMDFGETETTHKFEYAAKIGIGFAYLTVEENNDFRFSTFESAFDRLDGGRSNHGEVLALIDRCNDVTPTGESDIGTVLESYAASVTTRSLIVVVSDFLEEPADIESGVAALAAQDHDVLCAQVLAPEETDPAARGDTIFEDPESEITQRTYFGGSLRQQYRERLSDHVAAVEDRCDSLAVDYERIDTGEDFFDSFAQVWLE